MGGCQSDFAKALRRDRKVGAGRETRVSFLKIEPSMGSIELSKKRALLATPASCQSAERIESPPPRFRQSAVPWLCPERDAVP